MQRVPQGKETWKQGKQHNRKATAFSKCTLTYIAVLSQLPDFYLHPNLKKVD